MAVRIENQAEPIPGYKLIDRLGGGGFGEVWRAEAPGGFHKAIKFVYGDLQDVGDEGVRAEQELKALARVKTVRHPYILSLERFDIIDGQLLIVMELADRNLWDRFKECRSQGLPGIPRDELLRYMEETSEALDLMNNQYQLQHLDIKPQNLFLVHNHVKVADFGLVKDLEGMAASVTGGVTPVYAAPETFDGWVSRFSDQYSLAIVYQELLTGQRPFPGSNIRQLIMAHLTAQPDLSSLPPEERPILDRALAKNPDERFPTCREFTEALLGVTSGRPSSSARHRPDPDQVNKPVEDLDGDGPLTAPNRVTPDVSAGTTQWLGSSETSGTSTSEALAPSPAAPVEMFGEGALFPGMVIALGSQGLSVLQQIRENLAQTFGSPDVFPQLRLLFMDTDPEVLRKATRGQAGAALTASEILLTQLNRPSHYLRPREGRVAIDSWFNLKMLYRIPRTHVTTGVRALGRLAFWDNYRNIVRRLRLELSSCTDPNALTGAVKKSGLGLRSNRPRVYIVSNLAGGTGSGMLIDLAYVVRHILKEQGYEQPDLVGVFILPAMDPQRVRTKALSNTFAALTELFHFSNPTEQFSVRYDDRESPIQDFGPPFNRTIVLRIPDESDSSALRQVATQAGDFLFRDFCSPLGRAIDLARADHPGPPWEVRGQYCQTFGMFKYSWPRRPLTERTAQRLCQNLIRHWMSKDSKPIRDQVYNLVQEQWAKHQLGPEHYRQRILAALNRLHKQPTESLLSDVSEKLLQSVPTESRATNGPQWSVAQLRQALEQLEQFIGCPADDAGAKPGVLVEALHKVNENLVIEWGQKLAELVVQLIEEPEYRLAGAEEAIRQVVVCIEQVLEENERSAKDYKTRSVEAFQMLRSLMENPQRKLSGGRKGFATPSEVAELLNAYAHSRFQGLLSAQIVGAFLSLRGHLSDELREVNFCRVRLGELLQAFEATVKPAEGEKEGKPSDPFTTSRLLNAEGACRSLFPRGLKTMEEAVEHFLSEVAPEELFELDTRIQEMIRQQFTALVHVCLTSSNLLRDLEEGMMQEAIGFVTSRLTVTDVAEMFLAQFPEEAQALDEIARAFDEAAPEQIVSTKNAPSQSNRINLLAVPATPAGERFRQLALQALADVELMDATSSDDIILYREWPHLPLTDLEQFSMPGREAYAQMSKVEHFTPHSRIDIPRWRAPGADWGTASKEQGTPTPPRRS